MKHERRLKLVPLKRVRAAKPPKAPQKHTFDLVAAFQAAIDRARSREASEVMLGRTLRLESRPFPLKTKERG